mmetsp:Transcript_24199/g.66543  ORF Transcript_24199/g.66543 Transcript_24199/m.66543 type:complete len:244 (-) Transcript_24199:796-1527(-)
MRTRRRRRRRKARRKRQKRWKENLSLLEAVGRAGDAEPGVAMCRMPWAAAGAKARIRQAWRRAWTSCQAGRRARTICPAGLRAQTSCPVGHPAQTNYPHGHRAWTTCPVTPRAKTSCPAGGQRTNGPAGHQAQTSFPVGFGAQIRCPAARQALGTCLVGCQAKTRYLPSRVWMWVPTGLPGSVQGRRTIPHPMWITCSIRSSLSGKTSRPSGSPSLQTSVRASQGTRNVCRRRCPASDPLKRS